MTIQSLQSLLTKYGEVADLLKPLEERMEDIKSQLKDAMEKEGIENLRNEKASASYTSFKSTRFDQKVANEFLTSEQRQACMKEIEVKRFQVTLLKAK